MEKVSLSSIFKQSEEVLKSQLREMCLPRDYKEIQRVIGEHISELLSGSNEFRMSLNASDAELLNYILGVSLSFQELSLSDEIDFKNLSAKTEYSVESVDNENKPDVLENTLALLPTVVSAFFSPWLSLAVGGATVVYKSRKVERKKVGSTMQLQNVDVSQRITEQMLSDITNAIDNICKKIDAIIAKIKRDRADLVEKYRYESDSKTLERMYPQILNGLQYLYMENLKNEKKSQGIDRLLFQLGMYGYKIVEYSNENSGFFTQQIKVGIDEPEMYLPAIIKENEDGILLSAANGVLYIPQS